MKIKLLMLMALSLPLTSFAGGSVDNELYKEIDDGNKATAAAILRGDADAIANTYTNDGYVLSPSTPTIHGKENVRNFWKKVISSGVEDVKIDTGEVHSSGDLAYAIGTLTVTPIGGEPGVSRYVLVFKKVSNEWKLHIDIWTPSAK